MTDLLSKVKRRLADLNIKYDYVSLSERPKKKIRIVIDGKTIHFGAKGSITHLEQPNEKKRNAFHKRFENNKGYNDPSSSLYYSARVLW